MVWCARVLRRVFGGLAAVGLASLLAFLILDAAPGDSTLLLANEGATQAETQALRAELGLDRPILERYGQYVMNVLLRGDLGVSLIHRRPVAEMLAPRFLNTLWLAVCASGLAWVFGLLAGCLAAGQQGRWPEALAALLLAICLSSPSYGLALLFTQIFSVKLGWLPVVGGGELRHLVLPSLSLAIPTAASIARLVRANLLETARQPYVAAARARGVPLTQVWRRYIVRNSLAPAVALAGVQFVHLLGGAFVIESLFAWPGLGRLAIQAIFERDTPVVLGCVVLAAALAQLLSLLTDALHAWLDPRLRDEAAS